MYDRRFFASKLGRSALLSFAAMLAFAIIVSLTPAAGDGDGSAPALSLPLVALA